MLQAIGPDNEMTICTSWRWKMFSEKEKEDEVSVLKRSKEHINNGYLSIKKKCMIQVRRRNWEGDALILTSKPYGCLKGSSLCLIERQGLSTKINNS